MKTILVIDLASAEVVDAILVEEAAKVAASGLSVQTPGGSPPAVEGRRFFCGAGEIGWSWDGKKAVAPQTDETLPSKAELAAYAANRRWEVETGGITIAGIRWRRTIAQKS